MMIRLLEHTWSALASVDIIFVIFPVGNFLRPSCVILIDLRNTAATYKRGKQSNQLIMNHTAWNWIGQLNFDLYMYCWISLLMLNTDKEIYQSWSQPKPDPHNILEILRFTEHTKWLDKDETCQYSLLSLNLTVLTLHIIKHDVTWE